MNAFLFAQFDVCHDRSLYYFVSNIMTLGDLHAHMHTVLLCVRWIVHAC